MIKSMFKPLAKLLKALSSNKDPGAIACAFACGILLGFMPKDNALWYVLFVFMFFMRIQRGAFMLSVLVGAIAAPLLDPCFDMVGTYILTLPQARDTYIRLLDIPGVAFTRFNNTIVMGSLACGIAAYIPLYLLARGFVFLWRRYIGAAMRKLKFIQMIKQIPLVEKLAAAVSGD